MNKTMKKYALRTGAPSAAHAYAGPHASDAEADRPQPPEPERAAPKTGARRFLNPRDARAAFIAAELLAPPLARRRGRRLI